MALVFVDWFGWLMNRNHLGDDKEKSISGKSSQQITNVCYITLQLVVIPNKLELDRYIFFNYWLTFQNKTWYYESEMKTVLNMLTNYIHIIIQKSLPFKDLVSVPHTGRQQTLIISSRISRSTKSSFFSKQHLKKTEHSEPSFHAFMQTQGAACSTCQHI